jgi:hypothetical protein
MPRQYPQPFRDRVQRKGGNVKVKSIRVYVLVCLHRNLMRSDG